MFRLEQKAIVRQHKNTYVQITCIQHDRISSDCEQDSFTGFLTAYPYPMVSITLQNINTLAYFVIKEYSIFKNFLKKHVIEIHIIWAIILCQCFCTGCAQ